MHGRVGWSGLGNYVDEGILADLGCLEGEEIRVSIKGAIFVPAFSIVHVDPIEGPSGFGLGHPEGFDFDFFLGRFVLAAFRFGFRRANGKLPAGDGEHFKCVVLVVTDGLSVGLHFLRNFLFDFFVNRLGDGKEDWVAVFEAGRNDGDAGLGEEASG